MLRQLFHISSGEGEIIKPQLALRIGERHCSFAITDNSTGSLRELAWYESDGRDENYLPALFEKHPALSQPFFKAIVSFDTSESNLVSKEFSGEQAREILKIMNGVSGFSTIICEPVNGTEFKNVYGVNGDLYFWIKKKLGSATYLHQYTVATKVLSAGDTDSVIYADFRKEDFSVFVSVGKDVLLVQSFSYSSPDDVLYYLLKICQRYEFSPATTRLAISGLVDKQSALYNELKQYFAEIDFRDTEWKTSDNNNTGFPAHFFTALNDLNRCAS